MTSGSWTQMPSSENIRTWPAPAAIIPISVNCVPARPMVTAPTGCTSTSPTCWPRCHTWSVTTGLSATGVGVGHREHRRVATQSCCSRAGFDVFGVFASGFAQMRVQVDEAGQQDLAGGVEDVGVFGDGQVGADVGDLAVVDQHVDRVTLAVEPHPPDQNCAHASAPIAS